MEKLCECGCGGLAPIAKRTDSKKGWVKGQPLRFIYHHDLRGGLRTRQRNAIHGNPATPEHCAKAGSIGGLRRIELHGNPATPEGCAKGAEMQPWEAKSRGGKVGCHNRHHLANGISRPDRCDICAEDLEFSLAIGRKVQEAADNLIHIS
jgi:hypothetical protein